MTDQIQQDQPAPAAGMPPIEKAAHMHNFKMLLLAGRNGDLVMTEVEVTDDITIGGTTYAKGTRFAVVGAVNKTVDPQTKLTVQEFVPLFRAFDFGKQPQEYMRVIEQDAPAVETPRIIVPGR